MTSVNSSRRRTRAKFEQLHVTQTTFFAKIRISRLCKRTEFLKGWLQHGCTSAAVAALIILNSMLIGFTTDFEVHAALSAHKRRVRGDAGAKGEAVPSWCQVADMCFVSIFTAELLTRLVAQEMDFFLGEEAQWNGFDGLVVVCSLLEVLMTDSFANLTYIRILRMLRSLRALRLVRVFRFARFFRYLRLMVLSVTAVAVPLMWTALLLLLIMYLFSIVFLQGVASYIDADAGNAGDAVVDGFQEFFTSVPMALLTLFMCTTGGLDWWDIMSLVKEIGAVYTLIFVLFIALMVLGVLNVVTGIFVNDSTAIANLDQQLIIESARIRREELAGMLHRIFLQVDLSGSGFIGRLEMQDFVENEDVKAQLDCVGMRINEMQVREIFDEFDCEHDGKLAVDEFVVGALRYLDRPMEENFIKLQRATDRAEKLLRAISFAVSDQGVLPAISRKVDVLWKAAVQAPGEVPPEADECAGPCPPPAAHSFDAPHSLPLDSEGKFDPDRAVSAIFREGL